MCPYVNRPALRPTMRWWCGDRVVIDGRIVLRDGEVEGRRVDVVIDRGSIVEIGIGVAIGDADEVIDLDGGAVLPGLHDHHVHLLAMAARLDGIDASTATTPDEFDSLVRAATQRDPRAGDGWIRVAGHDEHRHGPLDRGRLDALVGDANVRVQHRSGLAWTLSSSALGSVGLDDLAPVDAPDGMEFDATGRPTGRLLRMDAWLAPRWGISMPSLARISDELDAVGITGVTDATHALGDRASVLRAAVDDGSFAQRMVVLGVTDPSEVDGWAELGPAKMVIDELRDPDPISIADEIARWHERGRAVAVHAVSRVENVATVAAFDIAGSIGGDRIEHGSVLPDDLDPILAAMGITVIVQPSLVRERGDHYLREVDPSDIAHLHRAASLLERGVRLAAGSDAPVTIVDPWAAIATASSRTTACGATLGEHERVDAATALGWFLTDPLDPGGRVRRVVVGAPADLCVLHRPLAVALASPTSLDVRATVIGGRLRIR